MILNFGLKEKKGPGSKSCPTTGFSFICLVPCTVGEGEGWMIWENGIEICIISYMQQITSPDSMHNTGCLGLVHWDDPEGWYREGGGRRVEDGNTCIPVVDSC